MNVSIGPRWEKYVDAIVSEGRYASASEVMREGLRLVEEREHRVAALRETIQSAIARGGSNTIEEVQAYLQARRDERKAATSDVAA